MNETEKILEKVESASIENALNTNKQDTSEDKKDLMKLIEKIYVDKHWNYFKRVIDFYYPAKDGRKYYVALRSLASYMGKPITTIVKGEYNKKLIKGIRKIHPDDFVFTYEGVSNQDLIAKKNDFATKKLAYFLYFNKNKNLIYERFMENIKIFTARFRKEKAIIKNITILAALKGKIPTNYKNLSNVIEMSNLQVHIDELADFESFKLGKRFEYILRKKAIKIILEPLKLHFEKLTSEYEIEIPYDDIIRKVFNLKEIVGPYKEFLELIKFIAFFHQKHRDGYKFKDSEKVVLLAHPNDFIFASEIAENVFMMPVPNLKKSKLDFFNYLVDQAVIIKNKDELSGLSIYDVQIEQAHIVGDYSGSKSTLILWLSEFCKDYGLFTRNQFMKNALVYYKLNKVAPLPSDVSEFVSNIKKVYNDRIEYIRSIARKKNSKLKFFPIKKDKIDND